MISSLDIDDGLDYKCWSKLVRKNNDLETYRLYY